MKNQYFRVLLVAFLSTMGLLLCGEIYARFYAYEAQPLMSGNQRFEEKYLVICHLKHHYPTLLLLGGAGMNKAIYPDLLAQSLAEQGLHLQVANLAFDGATSESEGKLLQAATCNGIRANLVVDSLPFEISDSFSADSLNTTEKTNRLIDKSYFTRCICAHHTNEQKADRCWFEEHFFLVRYWSSFSHRFNEFANLVFDDKQLSTQVRLQPCDHSLNVSYSGWNPSFNVMTETEAQSGANSVFKTMLSQKATATANTYLQTMCKNYHLPRVSIQLPLYRADMNWWKSNTAQIKITGFNDDLLYFSDPACVNCYGGVKSTQSLSAILGKEPYRHLLEANSH